MKEIWKDIPWYEWLYQASNLWRINSFFNWNNRILKNTKQNTWYLLTRLFKDKKVKTVMTHRVITITFIWPVPSLKEVNHINWIKDDNRIENLEYCTKSENHKHRFEKLWHKWYWYWKKWKDHNCYWKKYWAKRIIQYDFSWKIIKIWPSILEASTYYCISTAAICNHLNWKSKSSAWYKWWYNN